MKSRLALVFLLVLASQLGAGQGMVSLNTGWHFQKGEDSLSSGWAKVNIPHTWNSQDVYEDHGYYRGIGWYKKNLSFDNRWSGKQVYLKFEGVNQVASVYLNGQLIDTHIGGYNSFVINLTNYLDPTLNNVLVVKVDNSHHDDIIPLKGDFNFYGGIYRDIYLAVENPIHFNKDLATNGVFINSKVDNHEVNLAFDLVLNNSSSQKSKLVVVASVMTGDTLVSNQQMNISAVPGKNKYNIKLPVIKNPILWSPEIPYLYRIKIQVSDRNGTVLDVFEQPYGFRYFEFTADRGFFLNGKPLKLIGTNRHQDFAWLGNALSNDIHVSDVEMLKEMGGNFLRTAHYPQDPAVLQACDKLGILVSMEIPLDHDINDSDAFYKNSKIALKEMIRQHYNHPSIIIWAYMNEMLLGRQLERDKEKIEKIVAFAHVLEDLSRAEDPERYTMIPNHGVLDLYYKSGLLDIPMIVGWNVYFGWYNDTFDYLTEFMADYRRLMPNKPVMITEYGAGSDPRIYAYPFLDSTSVYWNSSEFDFSIDYQNAFHQSYLEQFHNMDFLSGTAVWNLFDFGSYARNDAVPHINSKGLVTQDRKPKDAYYIYQSWLSKEKRINFLSTNLDRKSLVELADKISVATNLPEVELFMNDKSIGAAQSINNLASWNVEPQTGLNHFVARGTGQNSLVKSQHRIYYDLVKSPFTNLYLNFGACTAFADNTDTYWLPARVIPGIVSNGEPFQRKKTEESSCDLLGTLQNIKLTNEDPLYQTGRVGLEEVNLNVEPGFYRIDLLISKIDRSQEKDVFEVLLSGQFLMTIELDEPFVAHKYSTEIYLNGTLNLGFKKVAGKTILNALQLTKID